MLLIESGLMIAVLALAILAPGDGLRFLEPLERTLARVARRRRMSVIAAGLAALALRAAVVPVLPIPYPGLQDEFSYQLMGDTFAHGRLTNPTHPQWVHFEAPFVIHRPTYCSMYYPAQGMFLALGQIVTGHPFWGVWFSNGLMCAAMCWMLQAWVPPFWAFLGALLAAIRISTFSYWDNSYYGGAVAALAGALILGALPRLTRYARLQDGLIMGTGFALLTATRPYEGLFFSLPAVAMLVLWILRRTTRTPGPPVAGPLLGVLLPLMITIGFLLYYFWRTTGNPLLPPYLVGIRTYSVDPGFAFLKLRPMPHYFNEVVRQHYLSWDLGQYEFVRAHPIASVVVKLSMLWFFYLGPLLTLPFLLLGFVLPYGMSLRDVPPNTRFLLTVFATTLAGMMLTVWINPHYAAPLTPALYALLMMAVCRMRRSNSSQFSGLLAVRALFMAAFLLLLLRTAIPLFHLGISNPAIPETWASPWNQLLPRADIENYLNAMGGPQLAIVRYRPEHSPREGWVSNHADIDHSKIVWAHDMGDAANRELIEYFKDRTAWLIEPDTVPPKVSPYVPEPRGQAQAAKSSPSGGH